MSDKDWKKGPVERLVAFAKTAALVSMAIGTIVIVIAAANFFSYYQLDKLRQLQRTPEIFSEEFIEGPATVTGTAREYRNTQSGSVSGESAVFYEYSRSRMRENRDGDMEQRSSSERVRAVDFVVEDDEGRTVVIEAADQADEISFHHAHSERERDRSRDGRRRVEVREREWRIEPGDEVFVSGYGREVGGENVIEFRRVGDYTPVVAAGTQGRHHFRQWMWTILGIIAAVISIAFLTLCLRKPLLWLEDACRPLVDRFRLDEPISIGFMTRGYVLATGVFLIVAFGVQGIFLTGSSMESDYEAAQAVISDGENTIGGELGRYDIEWGGDYRTLDFADDERYSELSAEARQTIDETLETMERAIERNNDNTGFPRGLIAGLFEVESIDPVPDAAVETSED